MDSASRVQIPVEFVVFIFCIPPPTPGGISIGHFVRNRSLPRFWEAARGRELEDVEMTTGNHSIMFPKDAWEVTNNTEKTIESFYDKRPEGAWHLNPWRRQLETTPLSFP